MCLFGLRIEIVKDAFIYRPTVAYAQHQWRIIKGIWERMSPNGVQRQSPCMEEF